MRALVNKSLLVLSVYLLWHQDFENVRACPTHMLRRRNVIRLSESQQARALWGAVLAVDVFTAAQHMPQHEKVYVWKWSSEKQSAANKAEMVPHGCDIRKGKGKGKWKGKGEGEDCELLP